MNPLITSLCSTVLSKNFDPSIASLPSISLLQNFDTSVSSVILGLKNDNDIGKYMKQQITDDKRYELLTNHFELDDKFQWPFSERSTTKNGKRIIEKRYLNKNHLEQNKWLKYSLHQKGLFCVPCALFSTSTLRLGVCGKLVKKPLDTYRKLLGEDGLLTLHCKTTCHQDCLRQAENFIYIYIKNPDTSIEVRTSKTKKIVLER
jgi:hypothetical protein